MPEVVVYAAKGRNADHKRGLCQDITDAVAKNFAVPKDAVVVQIVEIDLDAKSKGGVMFSER